MYSAKPHVLVPTVRTVITFYQPTEYPSLRRPRQLLRCSAHAQLGKASRSSIKALPMSRDLLSGALGVWVQSEIQKPYAAYRGPNRCVRRSAALQPRVSLKRQDQVMRGSLVGGTTQVRG